MHSQDDQLYPTAIQVGDNFVVRKQAAPKLFLQSYEKAELDFVVSTNVSVVALLGVYQMI